MIYKNKLYEDLISDISVIVKKEINEAYDNYLLEEYGLKDSFDSFKKDITQEGKDLYKDIKKLLAFIIKKLQETNQYKKAEKISDEYKKRVQKYIDEHKKLTPQRLLKIIITILAIYGSVSLVNDCRSLVNSIQHNIDNQEQKYTIYTDTLTNEEINNLEGPMSVPIDTTLSSKKNKIDIKKVNIADLPSTKFKHDKNYIFKSTRDAKNFIKSHENCLLYPYYATPDEEARGLVTIGYGHVILKSDGDLYKKVQQMKKRKQITRSYVNGQLNKKHAPNLINKVTADKFFEHDIKTAEQRAYNTIMNMDVNQDIKCYMLYNQDIVDGMTSICYNAGQLKQDKYSFIKKGLENCRYDYEHNCIHKGDYNVAFKYFKKIKDNPERREQEYNKFFLSANKPFTAVRS